MNRTQIESFLPHADRMILVERVISSNASAIRCACHDPCDPLHPLRQDGMLPVTAGIEYAAQAAALHAAISSRSTTNRSGHLAILQNVEWFVRRLDEMVGSLEVAAEQIAALPSALHYRFALQTENRDLLTGAMTIAVSAAKP